MKMTTPKPGDILIFEHTCFYPLTSWDDDVEAKPKDICMVIDVPERGEEENPNRIVLTFLHVHHEGHVNVVNWRWDWQRWNMFMKIIE